MLAIPAHALSLLRDADVENDLNHLARPILSAAGLPQTLPVLVVNDPTMNAFVSDGSAIFVNSGLLMKLSSAAELQFVLAHESSHIVLGHVVRRSVGIEQTGRLSAMAMGVALAAAAGTGHGALGAVGIGLASTAQQALYNFTRAEESAADRNGIRLMARAGLGTQGAIDLMTLFTNQLDVDESRLDQRWQTHPLDSTRLAHVRDLATEYGLKPRSAQHYWYDNYAVVRNATPKTVSDDYWFQRARTKIAAFTTPPSQTLGRKAPADMPEDIRLMREAIALHLQGKRQQADALMDRILALRPDDAYYLDLKTQILFEDGQLSAAETTAARAATLAPDNGLIQATYGHVLMTEGGGAQLTKAISVLEKARRLDTRNLSLLHDLGAAYAKHGEPGKAALATAERYALAGDLRSAAIQARRAQHSLTEGSPEWRRAQDVLDEASRNRDKGAKKK